MAVDKRCADNRRTLQTETAASQIQRVKIHLRKTLQNQVNSCTKDRLRR